MTLARVRRQLAFLCSFVCLLGVALAAATPTFWTVSSQADFLKGDVEDLSIDSDGRMFLGPAASVLGETSAPFLWSIVAGADGTLWAGSGNEGKVLKIARDGKVTTFFDAPELEVHAIAPAPQGGLYVATSPDGKIYSVAADGTSKTFFDPEDKYIWALATDPAGNVFAATGDKGVIYKITPDGKGARFYKTSATNVVSLAIDQDRRADRRNRVAGPRLPHRRGRQGVRAARFALPRDPRPAARRRRHHLRRSRERDAVFRCSDRAAEPVAEPSRPVAAVGVDGDHRHDGRGRPDLLEHRAVRRRARARRPGRGAIYRIRPDGLWDTVWETADDAPYDLIVEDGGSLLVGTGTEGKIFRLSAAIPRAPRCSPAPPPGRSPRCSANPPAASSAPPAIPGRCSRCRPRRRARAPTNRTFATPAPSRPGAPSAGAPAAAPARCRSSRDPATPPRRTRPGARGRTPTRTPTANRSAARTRATCSGARR